MDSTWPVAQQLDGAVLYNGGTISPLLLACIDPLLLSPSSSNIKVAEAMSTTPSHLLFGLPPELQIRIFSYLTLPEKKNLSLVCSDLYQFTLELVCKSIILPFGPSFIFPRSEFSKASFVRVLKLVSEITSRDESCYAVHVQSGLKPTKNSREETLKFLGHVNWPTLQGLNIYTTHFSDYWVHTFCLKGPYTCLTELTLPIDYNYQVLASFIALRPLTALKSFGYHLRWPMNGMHNGYYHIYNLSALWQKFIWASRNSLETLAITHANWDHPARNLPAVLTGIQGFQAPNEAAFDNWLSQDTSPKVKCLLPFVTAQSLPHQLNLKRLSLSFVVDTAWPMYHRFDWFNPATLQVLALTDCPQMDRFLNHYVPQLVNLKCLKLSRSARFSFSIFNVLKNLQDLEVIHITTLPIISGQPGIQEYFQFRELSLRTDLKSTLRVLWAECPQNLSNLAYATDFSSFLVLEELAIHIKNITPTPLRFKIPASLKVLRFLNIHPPEPYLPWAETHDLRDPTTLYRGLTTFLEFYTGIRLISPHFDTGDGDFWHGNLHTLAIGGEWCAKHREDHPRVYAITGYQFRTEGWFYVELEETTERKVVEMYPETSVLGLYAEGGEFRWCRGFMSRQE